MFSGPSLWSLLQRPRETDTSAECQPCYSDRPARGSAGSRAGMLSAQRSPSLLHWGEGYTWARSGHLCACYIIFCMFEILPHLKCFQVTSAWSPDPLSGSSRPSLASIRGQGWALGAWGQTFPCLDQALGEAEGLQLSWMAQGT